MTEGAMINKEAALGALSSQIRSNNFEGKKEFINNYHGLQFIYELLLAKDSSLRLQRKAVFLLNDIINTQADIFPDEKWKVSDYLRNRPDFITTLVDLLV